MQYNLQWKKDCTSLDIFFRWFCDNFLENYFCETSRAFASSSDGFRQNQEKIKIKFNCFRDAFRRKVKRLTMDFSYEQILAMIQSASTDTWQFTSTSTLFILMRRVWDQLILNLPDQCHMNAVSMTYQPCL